MDPIITKLLEGVPYSGMGSTLERNALIGVIRNLILQDKYTVDYILNYAESVGYSRQMAEDVFKELTGLSPKLIVNNNEYYNMPQGVPNMCIAWGISKSNKEHSFYIVPFSYGYSVMETDGINAPVSTIISATIPEAFDELKKVAKGIQTLDKIITKKLLETENVPTIAEAPHQINKPYAASPLQILKKNFKDKVINVSEFERQASKLLASEEITVDEAEDLIAWKQDLIDEDETYGNDVLELDEQWKSLNAEDDKNSFEEALLFVEEQINSDNNNEKESYPLAFEEAEHIFGVDAEKLQEEYDKRHSFLNKASLKKVTAENITLEDIEAEDNKEQVQEEVEKIEEKPVEEVFNETTPEQYFEDALNEDKVDTINDVVSKCIDKFAEKFKDFSKYTVKILSYNTKVLGDYKPVTEELVKDKELNANAILQVILQITNNAEETNMKKVLAVFSITNGELHWTGTVRGENDQVVAFTEEGLDALFEVEEVADQELEDII